VQQLSVEKLIKVQHSVRHIMVILETIFNANLMTSA